jgi:uncharacterized membrane protein YgdD (TMEM256/DUF423 family)
MDSAALLPHNRPIHFVKEFTMRYWLISGAIWAGLAVALGAFGAHGLRDILTTNGRTDTFQTAAHYQMVHALALFIVAWLTERHSSRFVTWAGYLFNAGIVLFSGSLYLLAVFDLRFMGAIAPLGGAAFITGWGCIAWASRPRKTNVVAAE